MRTNELDHAEPKIRKSLRYPCEAFPIKPIAIEKLAILVDEVNGTDFQNERTGFGWLSNIESAKIAMDLMSRGGKCIEEIASSIQDKMNELAIADYEDKVELEKPTTKAKKKERFKNAKTLYVLLPEDEQAKVRSVATALFNALTLNEN